MAFDRQIAAMTIYCEASSASQDERDAIAHVIVNRVKDGRFGKTIAEVCLKHMQFSEWNGDSADNANLLRVARIADDDPILTACQQAVAYALGGWPDSTHGATHYFDKSRDADPPVWALAARRTLTTDKFRFFAGVK